MDWEIVWTEPAVADLEQIVRSAASRSPAEAESLRTEMLESVDVLARFPLIGPIYERDRSNRTREILCRQYRIFYRASEEQRRVEILTLWHSARREPKLPNGRSEDTTPHRFASTRGTDNMTESERYSLLMARRTFLGRTAAGLGSLALASLLHPRLFAADGGTAKSSVYRGVIHPRHYLPKVKRVIWLYMAGGPSHLETFDYKPKLAADERPADARIVSPRASRSPSCKGRS